MPSVLGVKGVKLGPAAVLTDAEVQRLLATFSRRYPTSIRNRALVTLFYRTGLRCAEALDLKHRDLRLDSEQPILLVRSGKGGKSRVVGLHSDVVEALGRWIPHSPAIQPDDFVFVSLTGNRMNTADVRRMLSVKGRKAGIARCHPHAFRATLAVELVKEGVPLPAVRDVLGHSNLSVLDAYLRRVFPEDAVNAVINR